MPTRRSLQATRHSGFDVALRAGQPEAGADLRSVLERAHRADRQPALAQVQGQRRGDGVAEAVGDGNAEHDARAAAAVEVVGKQVRRERRQDVLDGAVLVDVAGDAQRGQVAHLVGGGDRAAEDEDGQPPLIDLADGAHQLDPAGVRQPEIEDDQIDSREVGAHAREQLRGALHRERGMTGAEEGRGEAVPHEGGVVGDDDGLGGCHDLEPDAVTPDGIGRAQVAAR